MNTTTAAKTLRVIFSVYSTILKKTYINVEDHRTFADAKLRAAALNWQIVKIEEVAK